MKVHFCSKISGNHKATCGSIAKYKSTLESADGNREIVFRCESHKETRTVNKKVVEISSFNQSEAIEIIQSELSNYIGADVYSKLHRNKKPFTGIYIKNVGIMCQDGLGKWKYVYYNQIVI